MIVQTVDQVINQLEDLKTAIEKVLIMDSNTLVYFVDNNILTNLELAIKLLKLERGIIE